MTVTTVATVVTVASVAMAALTLTGCAGRAPRPLIERTPVVVGAATPGAQAPRPAPAWRGGGYYRDDGPGDYAPTPEALAAIPDAQPKLEPLHRFANRPYVVFNRNYTPMTALTPYKTQGVGSWYGRKFHGQRTSSGETYDMYGMTAAHPTLPIPSYVRVTNPGNGRTVVVRVNDRGPFHADRIIDLSYTAAWKLGYIDQGSTLVEVESILSGSPLSPVVPAAPAALAQRDDLLGDLIQRQRVDQEIQSVQASAATLLPEMKESRGIFLQLGAFGNPDNAESFKAHLGRELSGATGLMSLAEGEDAGEKLHIQARAGIYRVQFGPWPDRAAAQRAAERVHEMFAIRPMIVSQ